MKKEYKIKSQLLRVLLLIVITAFTVGCSNQNVSDEFPEESVSNTEEPFVIDPESRAEITIEDPSITLSEDETTLYFYGEEDGKTYRYELNIYTGEKIQTEVEEPTE